MAQNLQNCIKGILCLAILWPSLGYSKLEKSLVRLFVSGRAQDVMSPWEFQDVFQNQGIGLYVGQGRILTTRAVIENAQLIEMQKFGESQKTILRVFFEDPEANLALLTADEDGLWKDLTPLTLGEKRTHDADVEIIRARDQFQLSRFPLKVQEIALVPSATGTQFFPAYGLKTTQSGFGMSEPLITRVGNETFLSGLVVAQDNQTVYAYTVDVLKHFLEDDFKAYKGFGSLGVELLPLTSPDLREILQAPPKGGVRVGSVFPGSPFEGLLFKDDVVLNVGGKPLSEYGTYEHPVWGQVHIRHEIARLYGGDEISLKISRKGVLQDIKSVLKRTSSNQATLWHDPPSGRIPFRILGGLILQELSEDYLKAWGKDWRIIAPLSFLYPYHFLNYEPPLAGGEQKRLVVLTRVLGDKANRGYTEIRNVRVTHLNKIPISSLKDAFEAFKTPVLSGGNPYLVLTLETGYGEIILGYRSLEDAHQRMQNRYGIHDKHVFFEIPPELR